MDLPIIARVECRSEGVADERPQAVWIGGERLSIRRFVDSAVVGGRDAGDPITRSFTVELGDGLFYRLQRILPDGEWRTSRISDD